MKHKVRIRSVAIAVDGQKVLLQRQLGDPAWALPGGRVEPGEFSREAIRREIEEETGLSANVHELRLILENSFELNGICYQSVEFYYNVEIVGAHQAIRSIESNLEYRWIDLSSTTEAIRPEGIGRLVQTDRNFTHLTSDQLAKCNFPAPEE